ncbi:MAG: SIR2 family protein [Pseudomonadota bacterium]
MAIDPDRFSLQSAIDKAWKTEGTLSTAHKELISLCCRIPVASPPSNEGELDTLQRVVSSCEFLQTISSAKHGGFLSDHGEMFPRAIREFIHSVACQFHIPAENLPKEFSDELAAYITFSKSHVATTNYDNLLYQSLIERDILKGFDSVLRDGFTNTKGFQIDHLKRFKAKASSTGFYLHLHGSPLYFDDGDLIRKRKQSELVWNIGDSYPHIVLTHVEHKMSMISSSRLLSGYWTAFEEALGEVSAVLLFGYSGLDKHLNEKISLAENVKNIEIIEWAGSGEHLQRQKFWEKIFPQTVSLERLDNILSFSHWDAGPREAK